MGILERNLSNKTERNWPLLLARYPLELWSHLHYNMSSLTQYHSSVTFTHPLLERRNRPTPHVQQNTLNSQTITLVLNMKGSMRFG